MLALPIFPGRRQPSIFGAKELNYRVRNENGWTLSAINTNFLMLEYYTTKVWVCQQLFLFFSKKFENCQREPKNRAFLPFAGAEKAGISVAGAAASGCSRLR